MISIPVRILEAIQLRSRWSVSRYKCTERTVADTNDDRLTAVSQKHLWLRLGATCSNYDVVSTFKVMLGHLRVRQPPLGKGCS